MIQTLSKQKIAQQIDRQHHRRLSGAYDFAAEHLSKIRRRSGENYFQHGCEVSLTVQEINTDSSLVLSAICHDLLVHPKGEQLLKNSPLRPAERMLVKGMHALRGLHIDEKTKDLDILIDKFTQDQRLVLLRMAHRLNDVRHLDRFAPKLRYRIAKETLHMYTSIAGRLGLNRWRQEMEDICFRVIQPEAYQNLTRLFKQHQKVDEISLQHSAAFLEKALKKKGIKAHIKSRIKGHYSAYRKMVLKKRTFDELTDRLALRVIVPTKEDCYLALAVVHEVMHPIAGKLKDYIGAPKENGYRSIHTVVYPLPGVTEQPIEIQIRTEEMHQECEYSVISHTNYKIWNYVMRHKSSRVNLFRNLEQLRAQSRSPKQFEQALRTYFRQDQLMIFDERNNLYHLAKPASVMDFACAAYGDKAQLLKAVFVNGKKDAITTPLSDGDVVYLTFSNSPRFTKKWSDACLQKPYRKQVLGWQKNSAQKA